MTDYEIYDAEESEMFEIPEIVAMLKIDALLILVIGICFAVFISAAKWMVTL